MAEFVASIIQSAGDSLDTVFKALGIQARNREQYAILGPKGGKGVAGATGVGAESSTGLMGVVAKFAITAVEITRDRTVTSHPIEGDPDKGVSGRFVGDHIITLPRNITISGTISREYVNANDQLESLFSDTQTYTIRAKGKEYPNMVVTKITRHSSQDRFDAIGVSINFVEFMATPVVISAMKDTALPQNGSVMYRGPVQTTAPDPKTLSGVGIAIKLKAL